MATVYARRLIKAIRRLLVFRIASLHQRSLLLVMLCPFLSARSLREVGETSGVGKNALYRAVDDLHEGTVLAGLRKVGVRRLIEHLRILETADSSTRSRRAVTLCADDCTRKARGDLGGLGHPCYSGADKRVVFGVRLQALVAVIGEGSETLVLDVRVVPPRHEGAGRQRATPTEWLHAALTRLDAKVRDANLSLKGCYLSIDSAYAAAWFCRAVAALGLTVVSELRSNWIVWGPLWTPVPAGLYFAIDYISHWRDFKPMEGEKGNVCYRRNIVQSRTLGRLLVVSLQIGDESKDLFTPLVTAKAKTVRRVALRRWQIERLFWDLKQLLGFNAIHQQTRHRVLARIYLACILFQATKDAANELKVKVDHMCCTLRHSHPEVLAELGCLSASVRQYPRTPAIGVEITV